MLLFVLEPVTFKPSQSLPAPHAPERMGHFDFDCIDPVGLRKALGRRLPGVRARERRVRRTRGQLWGAGGNWWGDRSWARSGAREEGKESRN